MGTLALLILIGVALIDGKLWRMMSEQRRHHRAVEHKFDLILTHLGIDYAPATRARWQELADEEQKIPAIKAYREEHGAELVEAKRAVEEYIATKGGRA